MWQWVLGFERVACPNFAGIIPPSSKDGLLCCKVGNRIKPFPAQSEAPSFISRFSRMDIPVKRIAL
jgi:hypothetical protein